MLNYQVEAPNSREKVCSPLLLVEFSEIVDDEWVVSNLLRSDREDLLSLASRFNVFIIELHVIESLCIVFGLRIQIVFFSYPLHQAP